MALRLSSHLPLPPPPSPSLPRFTWALVPSAFPSGSTELGREAPSLFLPPDICFCYPDPLLEGGGAGEGEAWEIATLCAQIVPCTAPEGTISLVVFEDLYRVLRKGCLFLIPVWLFGVGQALCEILWVPVSFTLAPILLIGRSTRGTFGAGTQLLGSLSGPRVLAPSCLANASALLELATAQA